MSALLLCPIYPEAFSVCSSGSWRVSGTAQEVTFPWFFKIILGFASPRKLRFASQGQSMLCCNGVLRWSGLRRSFSTGLKPDAQQQILASLRLLDSSTSTRNVILNVFRCSSNGALTQTSVAKRF